MNFDVADKIKIINNEIDNTLIKKHFWDQTFTNTFIYYNSKINSIYKNNKPAYNAILSIIYESSICEYDVGLSIEKRWLKWLLLKQLRSSQNA